MTASQPSVANLVSSLRERGIELSTDGKRVLCHGARGLLTRDVQLQLAARKHELLAYLLGDAPASDRPLSYAQQRLWFLDQMQPGSTAYTLPMAQHLAGPLDVAALQQALSDLVRRHEILRTNLPSVNGAAVQRVHAPHEVELPVIDLRDLSQAAQAEDVRRRVIAEFNRPFDVARDRLLRTTLLALGADSHVLIATLHHAIGDGWSFGIVGRELAALYAARRDGGAAALPPPRQYSTYVDAQRALLDGNALPAELEYWKAAIGDMPHVLALPGDHPRPAVQSVRAARVEFTVDGDLTTRLRDLSRSSGATLFMTLLAGIGVLLGRHSRQPQLLLGTPVAGRHREETESVIGCLVNTLALGVDLTGNPTFAELLGRVRETTLGAYDHQDVPFERLVEALQPDRDLSRNPLVQVSVGLHNLRGQSRHATLPLPGLTATAIDIDPGTVRFDLEFDFWEADGCLQGRVLYAAALFDAGTIERLSAQLCTLLRHVVADPLTPVQRIPLLTAEQRLDAITRWNPAVTRNGTRGLHELVAEQAARTPDAVAVSSGGDGLTYRDLIGRAQLVAQALASAVSTARTPGKGVNVVVCLDRGVDTVVAPLGVLQAGAAFVAVDPDHPSARAEFVIRDCGAAAVVTQEKYRGRFASLARVICIEDLAPMSSGTAPTGGAPIDPEHVAYVMYTSGSTGTPKGVAVPHRAVVGMLDAVNRPIGLRAHDVFLAVTTTTFDISVLELFLPLLNGARVVVATREETIDSGRLIAAMEHQGVTAMQATPATWWMLVESGWPGRPSLQALCGGEALPSTLAVALRPRCRRLWNLYGPTETTIWSAIAAVEDTREITIGLPLANTSIHILDDYLEPVAAGMIGEIWIGGEGVSSGYVNRPDLTAERFLPDPFSDRAEARLYRTGDLGRRRGDGQIVCLGRVDHQLKFRGFRIEAGEIEAGLVTDARVAQAAVRLFGDQPSNQKLVAYVVPAGSAALDARELRASLSAQLPAYLLPTDFVVVSALPQTANGKIDRAALQPPARTAVRDSDWSAPVGDIEQTLARIWAEVLEVDRVSVRDNFFDLGGHSLLLARIRSRIDAELRRDVAVVDLFRFPTIRALADHLAGERAMPVPVIDAAAIAERQRAALERLAQMSGEERGQRA